MRIYGAFIAAALLIPGVSAHAQPLPEAKAFVTGLYTAYQHKPDPDYLGRQIGGVFAPDLIALIREEAAGVPKGDVGALDGDPICDCQDWQISDVQVSVTSEKAGLATAEARFRNAGEPQSVRLDLVAVQGRWRVADVHSASTPSLVGLLRDGIVQNASAKRR